ncbi:threonine/serine exporter family protein [Lactobacillus corticis]|uniref:Membrane protein n=1 Tax=Lactobacillus corticis TaxID=2201249 RepID=A0A916QHL8_9LACO|nr:threonine/serine exporter family protein [Lactobacillus corticis]GFZ27484.1 membrane protein [Lactobacillus corticis]
MVLWLQVLINIIFSYLASVGFALTINVPRRALNLAGINGVIGWMIYWLTFHAGLGRAIPNTLGALAIGICSLAFSRMKKCPVTVFNIPALVPLVPGVPAYQAMRAMMGGNTNLAMEYLVKTAIITGAIGVGFLLSTMLTEFYFRIWRFYRNKKNKYNTH